MALSRSADIELMLKDYDQLRKGDANGVPTKEALLPKE